MSKQKPVQLSEEFHLKLKLAAVKAHLSMAKYLEALFDSNKSTETI